MTIEQAAPEPGSKPPRRHWLWLLSGIAGGAVVGVGVTLAINLAGEKIGPAAFTMHGVLRLDNTGEYSAVDEITLNEDCQGRGGYSDLAPGTAVTVADSQGHIVATGRIDKGTEEIDHSANAGFGTPRVLACDLNITVPDVPDGLPSYAVTISHRGTQVMSSSEVHAGIRLSIGGN
ncbi:hypothetical protein FNH05_05040 [Amycolatopsis rhizosphaerae]|uniref:Uncharacterized protein n=1 Tax=Amycolatopsis rhizosphaerae TaxID=2053003 RepID=A0A558DGF4_9PSEU|nr:hypothetical protein [Amycolatopsis rhizosphaerae]TVT60107.1 hypothetical protein FNH05_05040 [Amycolatopsis rhizosphaerae]